MADTAKDDAFAAARANIRETVKWLIAAFAGVAAAVLGSSPLTGFGALDFGWRLELAIAGGAIGMVCVFAAILVAVRLLVQETFFFADLVDDGELNTFVDKHSTDLLPREYPTLEGFVAERRSRIDVSRDPTASDAARADADEFLTAAKPYVDMLTSIAMLERMRRDFRAKGRVLVVLAVGTMLSLGVFAWAANPPKADDKDCKIKVGTLHAPGR